MSETTHLSFSDIFRDIVHYRLLVCNSCRFAVSPLKLSNHLSEKHADSVHYPARESMALAGKAFSEQGYHCDLESFKAALNGKLPEAVPGIDILYNGIRCGTCGLVQSKYDSMRKHLNSHSIKAADMEAAVEMNVSYQKIFSHPPGFTEVQRPLEITTPNLTHWVSEAFSKHDNMSANREASVSQIPTEVQATDTTPWLERTQWAQHLAGLDSRVLVSACRIPSSSSEPKLHRVCHAVAELLDQCYENGKPLKTNNYIRRILCSRDTSRIEDTTVDFNAQYATLQKSWSHWKKFICFLLRTYKKPDEHRLVLNSEQRSLLIELDNALDEHQPDDILRDLVLRLSMAVQTQSVPASIYDSPLLNFTAVEGIDELSLVLKTPSSYTSILTSHILIARVLHLENGFPPSIRNSANIVDAFKEYHRRNIADESMTPIVELLSLRAYGLAKGRTHNTKPTCSFNEDHSIIYYKDNEISIEKIKQMVHSIIGEAQRLLCDRLVFRPLDYLDSRDPGQFSDDLTFATNGKSFLDLPANSVKLGHGGRRVMLWLEEAGKLSILKGRGNHFDPGKVNDYEKLVGIFLEYLIVLGHMTSGLPGRAREVTSMKLRNTWHTMRNVFIQGGDLMLLTEYVKTQNMTGNPMVIARFLPAPVARLFIAFIADVQPFLSFLQDNVLKSNTTTSPFLWHKNGQPTDTSSMSKVLSTYTTKYLDTPLTVQPWRHICIAIDRDIIREPDSLDLEDSAHDLQAAHGSGIAAEYGIRHDLLAGLTTTAIREFRRVSRIWHDWLQLQSTQAVTAGSSARSPSRTDISSPIRSSVGSRSPDRDFNYNAFSFSSEFSNIPAISPDREYHHSPYASPSPYGLQMPPQTPLQMRGDGQFRNRHAATPSRRGRVTSKPHESSASKLATPARGPSSILMADSSRQAVNRKRPLDNAPAIGSDDHRQTLAYACLGKFTPKFLSFRSRYQQDALQFILHAQGDLIAVLPTSGGKSLLFMGPALMFPAKTCVVVIPYVALLQNTLRKCHDQGISAVEWTASETRKVSIVFVGLEHAVEDEFLAFIRALIQTDQLTALFFDEIHLMYLDPAFRHKFQILHKVANFEFKEKPKPLRVALTATLTDAFERQLRTDFRMEEARIIRAPTFRANISYNVLILDEPHTESVAQDDIKTIYQQLDPSHKMIVFPGTIDRCDSWANALGFHKYHAKLDEKSKSLEAFIASEEKSAIVATSALGTGIDIPRVGQVTFFDAYFELTNFVQQSGRAAREPDIHARCVCYIPRSVFTKKQALVTSQSTSIVDTDKIAMAEFLTTTGCRRLVLAKHMDDDPHAMTCVEQSLDLCDNCSETSPVSDHSQTGRNRFASSLMGPPPQIFQPPQDTYAQTFHLHGTGDESSPSMGPTSINSPYETYQNASPSDRFGLLSRSEEDLSSPVDSPSPLKRQMTSASYMSRNVNLQQSYQYPSSRDRYEARSFLKAIFNEMVDSCPVCWFQNHAEHKHHSFRQCPRNKVLDYNSYVAFVKHMKYPLPWACVLYCHAPRFVCEDFRDASCAYKDKLIPVVLLAFREPLWKDIILSIMERNDVPTETEFRDWLQQSTTGNNGAVEPIFLTPPFSSESSDRVTNAIRCFYALVHQRDCKLRG